QGGVYFGPALSPGGKVVAVRSTDRVVRLWDIESGKEFKPIGQPLQQPGVPVPVPARLANSVRNELTFSPDDKLLAYTRDEGLITVKGRSTGGSKSVRLWNVAAGREIARLEGDLHGPLSLAFSADGKSLAARTANRLIVWETATGRVRREFKGLPPTEYPTDPTAVAFSPDGKILAATVASAGQSQTARVLDLATGKELGQFQGHQGGVECLAFTADGKRLLSGSSDTTALVWDVAALRKGASAEPPGLTSKELEALWADLIGDDVPRAFKAIHALRASPKEAVAFLKARLKPAEGVDAKKLARLVADLGSDTYTVRQKASAELEKL